jgi:hypothetical protein
MFFQKFLTEDSCNVVRTALLKFELEDDSNPQVSVLKTGLGFTSVTQGLVDHFGNHPVVSKYLLLAPAGVFDVKLIRYQDGASTGVEYGPLFDGQGNRADLIFTLFLSKANSYGGGEHEVITSEGTDVVKGDLGDLSVHPAKYGHSVGKVIGGESFVLTGCVQSQVSDDNKRHILFRLHSVAKSLEHELGDKKEEILSLHQIHNELYRAFS